MRLHHTKNKGDLGMFHAQLDLASKGFGLLLPLTEHEAFDLVAYRNDRFLRVQVKYRAAAGGVLRIHFSTSWADRHGTHTAPIDKQAVDLLCVYCPDTQRCYYLDPQAFHRTVYLRLSAAGNSQKARVKWADDFLDLPAAVVGVASHRHEEA